MRVFLSHASESKPLVEALAAGLPGHVDRWLDRDEMAAGERFGNRIEDAIDEECDYLIACLDTAALAREWVPREVGWGLAREASLGRAFVIPLLLQDVREQLPTLGLGDRLHVLALDHSAAGLQRASSQLAEQLFALTSRLVESLRSSGRRELLDRFVRGFTAYQQAAYQWRASLGNALSVLTTNAEAFEHVRVSVQQYNAAADPLIAQLGSHRDRISAAWSRHRGLCEDLRTLLTQIEQVYRGEMFGLNRIHEQVHLLMAATPPLPPTPQQEALREHWLAQAGAALDALTARAALTTNALEREIE